MPRTGIPRSSARRDELDLELVLLGAMRLGERMAVVAVVRRVDVGAAAQLDAVDDVEQVVDAIDRRRARKREGRRPEPLERFAQPGLDVAQHRILDLDRVPDDGSVSHKVFIRRFPTPEARHVATAEQHEVHPTGRQGQGHGPRALHRRPDHDRDAARVLPLRRPRPRADPLDRHRSRTGAARRLLRPHPGRRARRPLRPVRRGPHAVRPRRRPLRGRGRRGGRGHDPRDRPRGRRR